MSQKIKKIKPKQIIGMFTGDSVEQNNHKAQSLNINTYIIKPLNRQQFFNSLEYLGTLALSH